MFKENIPIFEQIKELVINNIAKGIWKEGDLIPSVRVFAFELGVNPNTVMNALKDLQRDGIIENKRGIGNVIKMGVAKLITDKKKDKFLEEKVAEVINEAKIIGINKEELHDILEKLWNE